MGLLENAILEKLWIPMHLEEGKSEDQNTPMDNTGTVCIDEG